MTKIRIFAVVFVIIVHFWSTTSYSFCATLISPASGGELGLIGNNGILDQLYGQANLVRIEDPQDNVWLNGGGQVTVTSRARFAGFSFSFGYLDKNQFHPLFQTNGYGFSLTGSGVMTFPSEFQWGLNPSGASLWSSNPSDNPDLSDHMVTFLITSGARAGNYVIAWEDLWHLGDHDYNDLVLEVSGAAPLTTPEPGSWLLLSAGVLSMVAFSRLRFPKRYK